MKLIVKIVLSLVVIVILAVAGFFGALVLKSPGTTPGIASENSVAQLIQIELGGIKQWVLIRGYDVKNPVLLILHGGPGSPELAMVRKYTPDMEKHFTVVNWEQRGSCKSYSDKLTSENMKIAQFVSDAKELTAYLKKRFNKDKIYIEGHSWGSALGALLVQEIPGDIKAFIGIGQVSNMMETEKAGYGWVLSEAKNRNDKKAIKELSAIGAPPYIELEKTGVERRWVMAYGGTVKEGAIKLLLDALVDCGEYTFKDKFIKYAKGSMFSLAAMWPEITKGDMYKSAPVWKVPVYVMAGKYDMTVDSNLQKKYFDFIKAPKKEFFVFENSAHMCSFEEPGRYMDIMVNKVLKENENR
jgi:pimeloyl-ACP methyl ester carboxylesterase